MARKISFKKKIAECLDNSNASVFQTIIHNKLVEKLDVKKMGIISEMVAEQNTELQVISQIITIANSFGGFGMNYETSVMNIRFNDSNSIKHFTQQLDQLDGIDYYEISEPNIDLDYDTGGSDLEYQGNRAEYEVTIYLDIDIVSLPSDLETYFENLNNFEESCNKKKKTKLQEKTGEEEQEEQEENDLEDEEEEQEEQEENDLEDEEEEECKKESLDFSTILDKVALHEFLMVKTAHWNKKMHKAVASTDKICPPGRTGADCKTILSAQQKMQMRKRMSAHLKKMSGTKRSLMATHGAATRAFIKQHNLMSKSAARAKM